MSEFSELLKQSKNTNLSRTEKRSILGKAKIAQAEEHDKLVQEFRIPKRK